MTGQEEPVRLCILISMVCVLTAFGSVQPEPGFNLNEVVRQVHTRRGQSDRIPSHPTADGRERPAAGGVPSLGGGAEFLIDTNSTLVPAPGFQNEPVIGFDGANFLVVWEDRRIGSSAGICAARVTPEGTVLDPSGFVVSQGAEDRTHPALGFDGQNFLVVWEDNRGHFYSDIYGTRVTPQGTVLDTSGFAITQGLDHQELPALAFDGANFLVVWQDYPDNAEEPDIYAARVTPQGAVLDSGFVICQAERGQYGPVPGFGGTNFLVVWQDGRDSAAADIYGTLVTPEGVVIVPDGYAIAHAPRVQGAPALAFDNANFLLVWQDSRSSEYDIWGTRVTPGGSVLDLDGILISQAGGPQVSPAPCFDGTNFFVVWQDGRGGNFDSDIYGARVTSEGTVLDLGGIAISQAPGWWQFSPALGFDGANFLAVWQDYRAGVGLTDIYGARVTPDTTVLDPDGFVIPRAARDQFTPALAFDGANFFVVWEDHRSGIYSDIYGARVTPEGTVLDPDGIVITEAAGWQYSPAIGFDGANFLVVWEDFRGGGDADIYGARVTPGGTVLDPDGIVITEALNSQYSPALAFDGANFLVVWEDNRAGDYKFDIYGARVTPGGTVLDTNGIIISEAAGGQYAPAIGFDGANFLVAWTDYRDGNYSDIYGARVTPQGTVIDRYGFVISPTARDQSSPVLGFDGANFLVAWTDYRSGVYSDIFGSRVTPGGAVLDPSGLSIARAAGGQCGPALGLGFDGENFLVVWEDYRSNSPDIYGALVTPAGVASDTGWVVKQEGSQFGPALALGTDSELFLVYQGWAGRVGGKTYNTDRVWGKTNPVPGSIEEGRQLTVCGPRPTATVVRGILYLPRSLDLSIPSALLDISGRKVLDLHPGANDVRALAPGVYFVTGERRGAGNEGWTLKVVVQR